MSLLSLLNEGEKKCRNLLSKIHDLVMLHYYLIFTHDNAISFIMKCCFFLFMEEVGARRRERDRGSERAYVELTAHSLRHYFQYLRKRCMPVGIDVQYKFNGFELLIIL